MKKENIILHSIIEISKQTKDKRLETFDSLQIKKLCKPVKDKFNCTSEEALIFAIMFSKFFESSSSIDIKDLAYHLDCNPIELLKYEPVIRTLLQKKLVALSYDRHTLKREQFSYLFKKDIIKSILNDTEPKKLIPIDSNISLLAAIQKLIDQYTEKEINFEDVEEELTDLLETNKHISVAQKLLSLDLTFELKVFLLYVIVLYYKGDHDINLNTILDDIFWEKGCHFHDLKKAILRDYDKTLLFKLEILKIKPDNWRNDVEIELTQKGAEYLFGDDACMICVGSSKDISNKHIIFANDIKDKSLFYNTADLPTIDFIQNLLQEEKFKSISNRLKENNMPSGITMLLHGKPGTGKTETVYQLAKLTQRNIYRVDISKLKSMWFGESQKIIKKLFDDYYKYMETQDNIPILFFNEADGVINKRKESNSSQVAQTENEIQNIILQEMEDFKGILMATTNLIDNIDNAFDRRFLFKLELTVPTIDTRFKIYRSLLKHLNDDDLEQLAKAFDFSGGVIQNIVRKATMHHVIHGIHPDINWYKDTCKQENFNKSELNCIGFKK
jgi:AAA+ superfamily predicted ATPase